MNLWQLARQLRFVLAAAVWPDAPGDRVFGEVRVSQEPLEQAIGSLRFPLALIRILDGTDDLQEPRITTARLEVLVIVSIPGDSVGEHALLGGARASQGSSQNRGLLEIEARLRAEAAKLGGPQGVRLRLRASAEAGAAAEDAHGYVVARAYQFEGRVVTDRDYPAPQHLVAVDAAGAGDADLTWTLQPNRYDRLEVILRRDPGATPPASPTAGTGVTLSGPLATSVTDTPGAGTFSYALFAGYDEIGVGVPDPVPTTSDRFSAQVVGTTRTVLVT